MKNNNEISWFQKQISDQNILDNMSVILEQILCSSSNNNFTLRELSPK